MNAEAVVEALRAALREFGRHTVICASRRWPQSRVKCDCGLGEALALEPTKQASPTGAPVDRERCEIHRGPYYDRERNPRCKGVIGHEGVCWFDPVGEPVDREKALEEAARKVVSHYKIALNHARAPQCLIDLEKALALPALASEPSGEPEKWHDPKTCMDDPRTGCPMPAEPSVESPREEKALALMGHEWIGCHRKSCPTCHAYQCDRPYDRAAHEPAAPQPESPREQAPPKCGAGRPWADSPITDAEYAACRDEQNKYCPWLGEDQSACRCRAAHAQPSGKEGR